METTLQDVDVKDLIPKVQAVAAKKASSVPVLACDALREKIKRLAVVSREYTDLKAEKNMLSADIKAQAEPMRVEFCRQTGKLAASIHVEGLAMYTCQNKYSNVSPEQVEAFGHPEYFTESNELVIDESKLSKEAILALVACGAAQYVTTFKPNTVFHTARSMDLDLAKKADALGIKPQQTLKIS